MPLSVILNGKERAFETLSGEPTLSDVIRELDLKVDRIAIEHCGEIAPRTAWQETRVRDGDRIELVHFVGGGSALYKKGTKIDGLRKFYRLSHS